ncbi:MAG: RimK-like protein [Candidatus Omnitrophica bacterium]|nr:RimK-like protein [Candidatus Omnitrophota bacterium]
MDINLFPIESKLAGKFENIKFEITNKSLKSIFFRRPTFLRDNYNPNLTPIEQLSRTQWAAFNRGLMIFKDCLWINHPKATYAAESKPFQIHMAKAVGFKIPKTIITNTDKAINNYFPGQKRLAIKTVDSVVLKISKKDAFIYTNPISVSNIRRKTLSSSPAIFQEFLSNKIDVRVTVVNNRTFSVSIQSGKNGVDGDWRLMKDKVNYLPLELPRNIHNICVRLVKALGLCFGAIDLAMVDNEYYFLEINPTGEWSWLVDCANLPIDSAIVDLLCSNN